MLEILKAIFYGIVEGITEWLPISSTGHLILLEEFVTMQQSEAFMEMFRVVIQLGAILAVVVIYFHRLWPFKKDKNTNKIHIKKKIMTLWYKILVACIPAAVIGLLVDDWINEHFYNSIVVALALIVVGILFIWLETKNKNHQPNIQKVEEIGYKEALVIGVFQLIAAIFPGTSRSGATILGGIWTGLSRSVATEFTFYLAIPVMFGASFLKLVKFGGGIAVFELTILLVASVVSFVVSIVVIKFLVNYIKKNDFKVFGYYRIGLGVLVLLYFLIK